MRSASYAARLLLPLILASTSIAAAQHPSPPPEDPGTVSGHVICNDTQHPARLAEVRLLPAGITPFDPKSPGRDNYNAFGGNLPAVETDMSGGFTIHNVRPGTYYLRIDLPGYITPLLEFTRDQLAKPTPAIRQQMDRDLQIVTVASHATVQADATLIRGASISGTVIYDDGSPAIGIGLNLFRPDAKGQFKDVLAGSYANTDDHGHYRFNAVPAGKYVVRADLSLSEQNATTMPMPNGNMMEVVVRTDVFTLPVYSGDALRRRDAKLVEADTGQETPDTDITLPISQLHDVSGTLLAKDGHTINAGKVALLYADDRSQLATVDISRDDGMFHFNYVPEGSYILSVQSARDVTHVDVPNAPGANPRTHVEDKTLYSYGTTEQPLSVQGDMQSILVTVPEKGNAASTASPASQ